MVPDEPDASDLTPLQCAASLDFWLLFVVFGTGAGCGLLLINNLGALPQSRLMPQRVLRIRIIADACRDERLSPRMIQVQFGRRHSTDLRIFPELDCSDANVCHRRVGAESGRRG